MSVITDPTSGEQVYTDTGFYMVTQSEDIYKTSAANRALRRPETITFIAVLGDGIQQLVVNVNLKQSEVKN